MAADLTGIINQGEFFSQHYLDEILEKDLKESLREEQGATAGSQASNPRAVADRLKALSRDFFRALGAAADTLGEKRFELSRPLQIQVAEALGYAYQSGAVFHLADYAIPILHEVQQAGAPYVVVLGGRFISDAEAVLEVEFNGAVPPTASAEELKPVPAGTTAGDVIQWLFAEEQPPRWVLLISGGQVILGERARWGKGQYLRFDLAELLARRDNTALGIAAVLLGKPSLAPESGAPIHDTLDEKSHKHAHGVSTDLKHAAREAVELIGNAYVEWEREKGKKLLFSDDAAKELTEECLIYLYRLLFLFYAEARAEELHSLPMNSEEYAQGYSLEMLRELEQVPLSTLEAQNGTFFDASLKRIFALVNDGHSPQQRTLETQAQAAEHGYLERGFTLDGLQSPLFDPATTPRLSRAKLKNATLQRVIRLLSLSPEGRRGRGKSAYGRGRISYAQLGINQLGSVYEGLLSYTGFFSKGELYEVHKAGEKGTDKTQQAYFVPAKDLARYSEEELLFEEQDEHGNPQRVKRRYPQGTFIFRLAGRDRESSASYYTPEVLTRCLVKYSLKELLKDRRADDILRLTVCEPAMGSGAFLVEAVNQLSDAYLERKQAETGERIAPDQYALEKQKVNTFIAAHNCYGVDLNPMAARLAGVSLWLATMHQGQKTPWFGGRLAVGNSLVGARLEVWDKADLETDEALAKALAPVVKKSGNAPDFEAEMERRLTLSEKAAPDGVAAVRKLFEAERRAIAAAEAGDAGDSEGSEAEEQGGGSAEETGTKRKSKAATKAKEDAAPEAAAKLTPWEAARKETLKELKKLLSAFKLPRHHRKPPTAVSAADVVAGKRPPGSVYHFLVWDAGMSPFESDAAIKELAPKEVEALKQWQKERTGTYSADEIAHLGALSDHVDKLYALWARERARVMDACRSDAPVWGQPSERRAGGYRLLAARELMLARVKQPGGAYAQLREAMDAWVALWGWPLEHAEKMPKRQAWWRFIAEVLGAEAALPQEVTEEQLSLLASDTESRLNARRGSSRPSERGRSANGATDKLSDDAGGEVESTTTNRAETLRELSRLAATRLTPHHWELEFAEVFTRDRQLGGGGFDLIVGNPPWIRLDWSETGILSDLEPRIQLDGLSSAEVAQKRGVILANAEKSASYLRAAEGVIATQALLSSSGIYPLLEGIRTNLYKAFICRGMALCARGVNAWIHQEGMLDERGGGELRQALYSRLRLRVQFQNKKPIFPEIQTTRRFGMIVLGRPGETNFLALHNVFDPITVDRCFVHDGQGVVPGIKTNENRFETRGHRNRLVSITERELALFSSLFDTAGTSAHHARLPIVHSQEVLNVLSKLDSHPRQLRGLGDRVFGTMMWNETLAKKDGTIRRETKVPKTPTEWIVSGPHFYVGNPFYKSAEVVSRTHHDYEAVELTQVDDDYLPRTNYVPACSPAEYLRRTPKFQGRPVTEFYRHVHREMLAVSGERTMVPAIFPPGVGHVHTCATLAFADEAKLLSWSSFAASLVLDFMVRSKGAGHLQPGQALTLPIPQDGSVGASSSSRALRLNCLTVHYADLWNRNWKPTIGWSSTDPRLSLWPKVYTKWSREVALRNHFERRWALVEIDALAALELRLTIDELCTIYRNEFPVLRQFEGDSWYDKNGRVVFTSNASLGISLPRKDFEAWQAHLALASQADLAGIRQPASKGEDARTARSLAARGAAFTGPDGTAVAALSEALQVEIQERQLVPFSDPNTAPFDVRDREADMRHAYAFFAKELNIEVPA